MGKKWNFFFFFFALWTTSFTTCMQTSEEIPEGKARAARKIGAIREEEEKSSPSTHNPCANHSSAAFPVPPLPLSLGIACFNTLPRSVCPHGAVGSAAGTCPVLRILQRSNRQVRQEEMKQVSPPWVIAQAQEKFSPISYDWYHCWGWTESRCLPHTNHHHQHCCGACICSQCWNTPKSLCWRVKKMAKSPTELSSYNISKQWEC